MKLVVKQQNGYTYTNEIILIITAYDLFCDTHLVFTKGQEISEENYGVLNPFKKLTKPLSEFFPKMGQIKKYSWTLSS